MLGLNLEFRVVFVFDEETKEEDKSIFNGIAPIVLSWTLFKTS